ncbi:MAG: hypothetical protein ACRDRX_26985 [Pseudonocardiaceae bacterium]
MTIREQQQAGSADASVRELVERLSAQVSALIRDEVLAGAISAFGVTQVRHSAPPVPEQAVQSTKRDIETVKESVHR